MRPAALALSALLAVAGAFADPPQVGKAGLFGHSGSTYTWLRFEVVNPGLSPVDFDVRLGESYRQFSLVRLRDQRLEAGERRSYQIPVPAFSGAGPVSILVQSRGEVSTEWANLSREVHFLQIAPVKSWATEQEMIDFATGRTSAGRYSRYSSGPSHDVAQVDPVDGLPDNWLCYLPFQETFILESSWNRLEAAERNALLDWVAAGGRLVVYGSTQLRQEGYLLGGIVRQPANPLASPGDHRAPTGLPVELFRGARTGPLFTDFPFLSRGYAARSGGLLLSTLFLIVAGPVNYIYWRRRNRIRMLMVSVPILSLAFCLLIGVFFIASQGFARKGGSFSLTLMDETADHGLTFSRHAMLSGLYPLGGFGFDPKTCFYPLQETGGDSYSFDYSRGHRLESGLFKPSVNFHYFTAVPFRSREHLVYNAAEGSITNGYELGLEKLLLRDGGRYLWADRVPSGGTVRLTELSPGVEMGWPAPFTGRVLSEPELRYWNHFGNLWRPMIDGSAGPAFMARLAGSPRGLEQGASIRSGAQCNVIMGLLETGTP
ncbi:hypothetical protein HS125_15875 [bacterium]|nr:hypothetical protein [bacterium]